MLQAWGFLYFLKKALTHGFLSCHDEKIRLWSDMFWGARPWLRSWERVKIALAFGDFHSVVAGQVEVKELGMKVQTGIKAGAHGVEASHGGKPRPIGKGV